MNQNLKNIKHLKNGPKLSIYKQSLKENHQKKIFAKIGKYIKNEPK